MRHSKNKFYTTRLKEDISELAETVRKQKEDLQRYAVYQKFMEKVLDSSPEVEYKHSYTMAMQLYHETVAILMSEYLFFE